MKIRIDSDGGKHAAISVSGLLEQDLTFEPILTFAELSGNPGSIRIDGLHWMIQEKMGFNLYWTMQDGGHELIMPLESRGSIDLERVQSQPAPEGAVGMAVSSFKKTEPVMTFFLLLDLVKR